jgi:hypothetical protein
VKFTTDDYRRLEGAVAKHMPPDPTERERWDALWAAVDAHELGYATLGAYNDDHIDTALRRIGKDNP